MKLIILLATFVFSIYQANCQDRFFDLTKEQFKELSSRMVAMAGNFKLNNTDSSKLNNISLTYANNNDAAKPLILQFEISKTATDKDSEKKEELYTLRKIYGSYNAVGTLYMALIGRSFDREAVLLAGKDRTEVNSNGQTHTIDLVQHKPEPGFWLLRTF